ncbi:AMP-binding protein [Sodalis sp. RH22]|uniref:AMP-binding protein n=1 Tax=unclassified Sodalis (in: enterobacteria) TaxID=2636512 RepID=UPI0039B5BCE8
MKGSGEATVNGAEAEEAALGNTGAEAERAARGDTGTEEEDAAPDAADSLPAVLARHLREGADRVFLICPETERTLTFAQLALAARRQDERLMATGHRPGDHIALLLPGGFDTVALCLSCMLTGYVPVPLSLLAADTALAWIITHCGTKTVITSRESAPRLRRVLDSLPPAGRPLMVIRERDLPMDDAVICKPHPADDPAACPRQLSARSPALLMYTSGTTGLPKGVVMTHGNMLAAAERIARWHRLTPQDRLLCALPLYHINGQVIGTLVPFVSGGSLVAPRRFSVSRWWGMVARYHCTWLNLVPTMIAFLLHGASDGDARYPWVKFARSASAPLPPARHRQFEQRFGITVIEGMGMTESGSLAFCNPHTGRVYGSVGLPCGIETAVAGPGGERLADNRCGEILLRGPNIMAGYHLDSAQTAAAIDAGGWLHTGDLGYRDARGFYFITGRMKEIIIKGGENIAPREIDEALADFPGLSDAAAFAIPDADYGQNIAAALVLRAGMVLDEAGLRAWCLERLGSFKAPVCFYIVTALPRGGSGKVQRLALCARFPHG